MRGRLWALLLVGMCLLSGCSGLLPEQTDAADEAILRVVTLSRRSGELTLVAVTAGGQEGDSQQASEAMEGVGKDYWAARAALKQQRRASLAHATDWVIEADTLPDALEAFAGDPQLTYSAHLFLLEEQTAEEFLAAFSEDPGGPARALDAMTLALGDEVLTMLALSGRLAAGRSCTLPVIRGEDGAISLVGTVEVDEWTGR